MRRRFSVLAAAAATALTFTLAGLGGAHPAHAAVVDVECATGTNHIHYSPGLLLVPQDVTQTTTTDLHTCLSSDHSLSTGGWHFEALTHGTSCISVDHIGLPLPAFDLPVTWDNGHTSTLTLTVLPPVTVGGDTVTTTTGTVTAGEFTGDQAQFVNIVPTINTLNCLAPPGITNRTGIIDLTITDLL